MPEIATRIHGVEDFLKQTRALIEREEGANQILFDLCSHLQKFPKAFLPDPYFKIVSGDRGVSLAVVLARPHHLVLGGRGSDFGNSLESVARDLMEVHWNIPGVIGPSAMASKFAGIWNNLACTQHRKGKELFIYQLMELKFPEGVQGKLKPVTMDDIEWATEWIHQSQKEALPGREISSPRELVEARIKACDVYYWEDEKPVSIVATIPAGLNGVRLSLVYTPKEFRGKGYASMCSASVSKMVLDAGIKLCTAIADADAVSAHKMYANIGYVKVNEIDEYTFEKAQKEGA